MTKIKPALGVWLVTIIWVLAIGGIWANHHSQLTHGKEIVLKTVPVDPRDMFRGEYVILNYDISNITRAKDNPMVIDYFRNNQIAYANLLPNEDGTYRLSKLTRKAPEDAVFIRGRVKSARNNRYALEYGIESFFLPEGEGKVYEEARNKHKLYAVVSVSPHGVAKLKRLEIR